MTNVAPTPAQQVTASGISSTNVASMAQEGEVDGAYETKYIDEHAQSNNMLI